MSKYIRLSTIHFCNQRDFILTLYMFSDDLHFYLLFDDKCMHMWNGFEENNLRIIMRFNSVVLKIIYRYVLHIY